MATQKQVWNCIRAGKGPDEILTEFRISQSELLELLKSPWMQKQLRNRQEIMGLLAAHQIAVSSYELTQKLLELAHTTTNETARKAVLSLLGEGMDLAVGEQGELPAYAITPSSVLKPMPTWLAENQPTSVPKPKCVRDTSSKKAENEPCAK